MRRLISPAIAAIIMAIGLLLAVVSGYIPSVFPDFATAHPVRFWGVVIGCVALLIGYTFAEARHASSSTTDAPAIPDDQAQRNRAAMLAKVRQTWIVGLLDRSVANDARIALDLQTRPDAVIDPIDLAVQRPNRPAEPLPPGIAISAVYDQLGGALLILGAPGAGKTTLLLELARDLLDRADTDSTHSIPVIFPLSSWAAERKPLIAWLIDELVLRYQVSRKLAQAWIDADAILPLLDGLDEVAEQHRNACVRAINTYRKTHGHFPLVVCSRIKDYQTLSSRLQLHGAIMVQPLSHDQVRTYLRAVGIPAIPRSDSPLWELLNTPLMLTVAALAYAGQPLDALAIADPRAARDHLFATYIDRMLQRNNARLSFTNDQTRHYLAFLAHQLQKHNQTTLYLEQMRPDWLPTSQHSYWRMLVVLTSGLVVGLGVGLSVGLNVGLMWGPGFGLGFGLVCVPIFGLLTAIENEPTSTIDPTEAIRWSWREARLEFIRGLRPMLGFGLISGLILGLVVGLVVGLISGPSFGLVFGLVFGLSVGLVLWLSIALLSGLRGGLFEQVIEQKTLPNQGIQRSGINALRIGLIGGLVVGLVSGPGFGLGFGLLFRLFFGLRVGLGFGLLFGLRLGLQYGGAAYLQHYLLRLLLIRNGSLPRRLVPFLNYATQRIFLRRVGGGYIFIHRLLLEHFAKQYKAPNTAPSSRQAPPPHPQ